jgi:hypothetical protein
MNARDGGLALVVLPSETGHPCKTSSGAVIDAIQIGRPAFYPSRYSHN